MSRRLEGVAWAALFVLSAAALYEALIALEVISIGLVPGEGAAGEDLVWLAATLGLLVAATVVGAHSGEARRERRLVWIVLAPAGVVYLVARWYSFDPYYLPSLRRYADDGTVTGWWIAVLVLAGIAVAVISMQRPRGGAVWSSVVLLVTLFTVFALPIGK